MAGVKTGRVHLCRGDFVRGGLCPGFVLADLRRFSCLVMTIDRHRAYRARYHIHCNVDVSQLMLPKQRDVDVAAMHPTITGKI